MAIPMIGEPGRSTFNRSFFNIRLDQLIKTAGGTEETIRITMFLSDGLRLGLCHIEELSDDYMVVRGHQDEPGCDLSLHVIPYGLIYRLEIDPAGSHEPKMGFKKREST